jgi:hypothetical protein
MDDLFLLSEAQMRRIRPYFPLSHGIVRVDDRRVSAGSTSSSGTGYGGETHRAATARTRRSTTVSCAGAVSGSSIRFSPRWRVRRQAAPADDRRDPSKSASHRRQPFKKGPVPRRIGRTKGGLNSKLHAVCDGRGRPLIMLLSEGQTSDFKGAASMLAALPRARELLGDKGYDSSVPTEKGSIQGETGSFRPFVTHPLCSLARPAAAETVGRVGSSGGSLPQLRPNICCCAAQPSPHFKGEYAG